MTTQTLQHTPDDAAISVRIDGKSRSVALAGELDLAAAPVVLNGLAGLSPQGDVLIDLAGLTFIDAAGLGTLVRVRNAQLENGFRLHLVRAKPAVTRVFELGGLAGLLGTRSSEAVEGAYGELTDGHSHAGFQAGLAVGDAQPARSGLDRSTR